MDKVRQRPMRTELVEELSREKVIGAVKKLKGGKAGENTGILESS